jgi:hypothetical protein
MTEDLFHDRAEAGEQESDDRTSGMLAKSQLSFAPGGSF